MKFVVPSLKVPQQESFCSFRTEWEMAHQNSPVVIRVFHSEIHLYL